MSPSRPDGDSPSRPGDPSAPCGCPVRSRTAAAGARIPTGALLGVSVLVVVGVVVWMTRGGSDDETTPDGSTPVEAEAGGSAAGFADGTLISPLPSPVRVVDTRVGQTTVDGQIAGSAPWSRRIDHSRSRSSAGSGRRRRSAARSRSRSPRPPGRTSSDLVVQPCDHAAAATPSLRVGELSTTITRNLVVAARFDRVDLFRPVGVRRHRRRRRRHSSIPVGSGRFRARSASSTRPPAARPSTAHSPRPGRAPDVVHAAGPGRGPVRRPRRRRRARAQRQRRRPVGVGRGGRVRRRSVAARRRNAHLRVRRRRPCDDARAGRPERRAVHLHHRSHRHRRRPAGARAVGIGRDTRSRRPRGCPDQSFFPDAPRRRALRHRTIGPIGCARRAVACGGG